METCLWVLFGSGIGFFICMLFYEGFLIPHRKEKEIVKKIRKKNFESGSFPSRK